MRNIEVLRDYFLGKDPQLKETLADNSLRLIGIPGREFVVRKELIDLKTYLEGKDQELADAIQGALNQIEAEEEARRRADNTLQGNIDTEELARQNADNALNSRLTPIETWKSTSDFVYLSDLVTALSNYYTKQEVNEIVAAIPTLTYEIVETLPTRDISTRTIYMVPSQDPELGNYYEEYMYIDNAWELIGTTKVDLSAYYTKTEIDEMMVPVDSAINTVEDLLQQRNDLTGNVVDFAYCEITTSTTTPSSFNIIADNDYSYGIYYVSIGEVYEITGKGGASDKVLWAIYDSQGLFIACAGDNEVADQEPLYMAQDGILVVNFTDSSHYPFSVYGNTYVSVDDLESRLVHKAGDTMTGGLTTTDLTVGLRAQASTVGTRSFVQGTNNVASGARSTALGKGTQATANDAVAEGDTTVASGAAAHAEGKSTEATALASHAEGLYCIAAAAYAHAEGDQSDATGQSAHAEGEFTYADGVAAHAEGYMSQAHGAYSHAENNYTSAMGDYSHSEGTGTGAYRVSQHVQGKYNIYDTEGAGYTSLGEFADIVGNGTADNARSNAYTLDWSGNGWFAGDVYVGSTSGTHKDAGSKKLATDDAFTGTNGLTDGAKGLVPKPNAADDGKFLCADGTWQAAGGGSTYTAGDYIDITNDVISVTGIVTSSGGIVEEAIQLTSGSVYSNPYVGDPIPSPTQDADGRTAVIENTGNTAMTLYIKCTGDPGQTYGAYAFKTYFGSEDYPGQEVVKVVYTEPSAGNDTTRYFGTILQPGEKLYLNLKNSLGLTSSAYSYTFGSEEQMTFTDGYGISYDYQDITVESVPEGHLITFVNDTGSTNTFYFTGTGYNGPYPFALADSANAARWVFDMSTEYMDYSGDEIYFQGVEMDPGDKFYIYFWGNYTPATAYRLSGTPAVLDSYALKSEVPKITYGTTDLTPGVSPLNDGEFYFVYE